MSNDEVYASGLLNRALEPATQPLEIQAFLRAASLSGTGCASGWGWSTSTATWPRRDCCPEVEASACSKAWHEAPFSLLLSEARLRDLIGNCTISPIADIAYGTF
jgi:hypothetical protein